jgi:DNA invertase Pin-like site-specific DNA recombinase
VAPFQPFQKTTPPNRGNAARARGRTGGRPPINPEDSKVVLASKLFEDKSVNLDDICATLKISKTTLYRYAAIGTLRHREQ